MPELVAEALPDPAAQATFAKLAHNRGFSGSDSKSANSEHADEAEANREHESHHVLICLPPSRRPMEF